MAIRQLPRFVAAFQLMDFDVGQRIKRGYRRFGARFFDDCQRIPMKGRGEELLNAP